MQSLEDRRVLALLGATFDFPLITANDNQGVEFTANTQTFKATGVPQLFLSSPIEPSTIAVPSSFDLEFQVDASGNLLGGIAGDDFVLTGEIDIDNDATIDVSGVLLTGEVTGFGFENGPSTDIPDFYDFTLSVTGGLLAQSGTLSGGAPRPNYFAGSDIGMSIFSEFSTFNDDFTVDFVGGNKATFGPTPAPPPPEPGIDIEKLTNGVDADTPDQAALIEAGDTVTWTYIVTNTGNVPFAESEVVVIDDAGTPGDDSDDFFPVLDPASDDGSDGILSPGEVWEYTASSVAVALGGTGTSGTLFLDGGSSLDGPDGNIRSYSAAGVNVNASAFSRDGAGTWETAYLGAYSGGLGVTDTSEGNGGNGTHRVDNVGRDNYVLFEFSEEVVVDEAFLDSVVGDSDLSVWIGNIPGAFDSHVTLSDSVLSGLGLYELNDTNSSSSRWADFNGTGVSGNVLVLAASVDDDTPDDKFKIRKVKFETVPTPDCYINYAYVTAGDVGDDDPSSYKNPLDAEINIVKYVDKVVESMSMTTIDFDGFHKGTTIGNQYPGVTISAVSNSNPSAGNRAMIFNSSNPTGGDLDLGTPNIAYGGPGQGSGGASNDTALGNILIISEEGDASDPDDDYLGGTFTFTFDSPVTINHLDVLDIDVDENGGSVVTLTTASGTQTVAIPTAGNNSYQRLAIDVDDVIEMEVNFVSSGAITELKYSTFESEKQWFDANEAPGVSFDIGEVVEFSYHVTNPGEVELNPVVVVDDNATPGDTSDDFNPDPVLVGSFNVGDTDQDGALDPGEEWIYTAMLTALVAGQYENIAVATGTPVNGQDDVTDDDPANYVVEGTPGIDIEKLTNGIDADTAGEAVEIAAGDTVTWTYLVTNTGTQTFTESEVVVVDDNGTPLNTSDDFHPTLVASSDVNSDGLLSPGEQWTFTASETAQAVTSSGSTELFYFDGSSPLDGPDGNVRTYSSGGLGVSVTGFSRDSGGNFAEAYVGAFSGGLGVTDSSEGNGGNGTHRVDNIGRLNYLVFRFSDSVVVDSAFLDSVVSDSDLSIWIGDVAGAATDPVALSDSLLADLAFYEDNQTSSSSSRWADFNAAGASGNVLVLAAWVDDATPEDQFKVRKLKVNTIAQGIYKNVGSVSVDGASDSDPSHYTNPAPAASGVIGDYVWNDIDRDGKQDHSEDGVAGVTVTLYDAGGSVVGTTTTGPNGEYEFTGLEAGDYRVGFSNLPQDYVFTRLRSDISDAIDSDADRDSGLTDLIHLDDHEVDRTIDAGIYEAAVDKMWEAEDYEWLDHPWKVKWSDSASGGKYLVAPNGSGSHYNNVPSGKKVKYVFDVDMAGSYELSALIRAKNGSDNSVWIRVDGGDWVQWHTPVTGYHWQWHSVTDGWDNDSVVLGLDAGSHTLEMKVREDGTKFDKFMISKLSTQTIVIDAMNTDSMTGHWEVDVDDDGNEFLVAGLGTHYHTPPDSSELTYSFTVDEAGSFDIYALVSAGSSSDNSFWLKVDDGEWIEWHLTVTGDSFQWQQVTDGSSQDAVSFDLSAGNHTLSIKIREDGTKLDKIVITNDQAIELNEL